MKTVFAVFYKVAVLKFKSNCNPSFSLLWLQLSKNYYGTFFLLEDKRNVISENFLISKSWLSFVKSLRNDSDIKFVADKPLNTGEMSREGGGELTLEWPSTFIEIYQKFTHFSPRCISYRNQSFDLLCKSNDLFLYEMQHWADMG